MAGSDLVPEGFGEVLDPASKEGNGSWSTSELADMKQERRVNRQVLKDEVEEAYHRGVIDALTPAGKYVGDLISQGQKMLDKLEETGRISSSEVAVMKMAQKAAEDVANRQLGKPVARHETKTEGSILGMILHANKDLQ